MSDGREKSAVKGRPTSHLVEQKKQKYIQDEKERQFENQRKLDLKVRREQRGVAGEISKDQLEYDSAKRVAMNDWEDAVRQNRTQARKMELSKSAVVKPQRQNRTEQNGSTVEHEHTHRTWGHLTDGEVADYGLIEGETLDEEGRVIPPWIGRAERYAGPLGEDEVRYPHDYGYGARGFLEASRGKVPPPQLHLKDRTAAPRRDPDLYRDVEEYIPYGRMPGTNQYDGVSHYGFGGPQGYALPGPYGPVGPGYPYHAGGAYGYGFPTPARPHLAIE